MSAEKFDREKANDWKRSHVSAVVLYRDLGVSDWSVRLHQGNDFSINWEQMRLAYLTDTPPQTAERPVADPIIQDILHRLTALEQSKNGEK